MTSACSGLMFGCFEGVGYGLVVGGSAKDLPVVAFIGQVFGAGVEDDFGDLLFAGGVLGDDDDTLLGEHPGDCAFGTEVASVF